MDQGNDYNHSRSTGEKPEHSNWSFFSRDEFIAVARNYFSPLSGLTSQFREYDDRNSYSSRK